MLFDLVELLGVIEGHLRHALLMGISNEGLGLARLRIDDSVRVDAHVENLLHLLFGGAVESSAQLRQQT